MSFILRARKISGANKSRAAADSLRAAKKSLNNSVVGLKAKCVSVCSRKVRAVLAAKTVKDFRRVFVRRKDLGAHCRLKGQKYFQRMDRRLLGCRNRAVDQYPEPRESLARLISSIRKEAVYHSHQQAQLSRLLLVHLLLRRLARPDHLASRQPDQPNHSPSPLLLVRFLLRRAIHSPLRLHRAHLLPLRLNHPDHLRLLQLTRPGHSAHPRQDPSLLRRLLVLGPGLAMPLPIFCGRWWERGRSWELGRMLLFEFDQKPLRGRSGF